MVSDDESDEGEEGDYTVYECPGLATVSTYLTPVMINLKRDVFTMFYTPFRIVLTHFVPFYRPEKWKFAIHCFQKTKHQKLLQCRTHSLPNKETNPPTNEVCFETKCNLGSLLCNVIIFRMDVTTYLTINQKENSYILF